MPLVPLKAPIYMAFRQFEWLQLPFLGSWLTIFRNREVMTWRHRQLGDFEQEPNSRYPLAEQRTITRHEIEEHLPDGRRPD